MSPHLKIWIAQASQKPLGHARFILSITRVNAGNNYVESLQDLIGIIQSAVSQDITFGTLKKFDLYLFLNAINFLALLFQPIDSEPSGIMCSRRMIRDGYILDPHALSRACHLLDRMPSIRIGTVAVCHSLNVANLN